MTAQSAYVHAAIHWHFRPVATGGALAASHRVIWFFEKDADVLVCEIRHAKSGSAYEFEIADAAGPITHRFDSPSEVIAKYLDEQSRLIAEGWRPRASNVTTVPFVSVFHPAR